MRDAAHDGLDALRGCLGDLTGELVLALSACGLFALGWWCYHLAPYPTVAVVSGLLLLAGYGVFAALRGVRGNGLIGGLAVAAVLAAGVAVLLLAYLPSCACLG